jgi:threonine dehydrogenase-like Zn-dependent dehydrogenase
MPRRLAVTGPFEAQITHYDDPPLLADQVLVKTEMASGKLGTTLAMFDNRAFSGQRFDETMRLFVPDDSTPSLPTPEKPWNMGTSGLGTVIEVGRDVTRWKVGDRVFGVMDIRETNICRADQLWALGDIHPHLALCIEPAYVAFHCIRESNVRYGEQVAIIGLGAIGLLAVDMARRSGAETIIAIDPLATRRTLAQALGADHVLDPGAGDVGEAAHRLTGGAGVDIAIELSGAIAGLSAAIRCTRLAGTVCSAGFYQSDAQGLWLGREWHHNRLTMIVPHGCGWGHPPRDYPRWDRARALGCIAAMMGKGGLSVPTWIDPVIDFEAGAAIFDLMRDAPGGVIKYAVTFP